MKFVKSGTLFSCSRFSLESVSSKPILLSFKAFEASLFGIGTPIGQAIAKYLGFGLVGQLIGGGLSALAWGLMTKGDDKKNKAMNNEAMKGARKDPIIDKMFMAFKEKYPNIPENELWKNFTKMLSELPASGSGTSSSNAVGSGTSNSSYNYQYQ